MAGQDQQSAGVAAAMFAALMPGKPALRRAAAAGIALLPWWRQTGGVGGDLWGMVDAGGGRIGIFVADCSGNGIEGGLGAVRVATMFGLPADDLGDPAALMRRFNGHLKAALLPGQSVAMIYGTLDPASGGFTYAAAGMPPPLCVDPVAAPGVPPGLSSGDGRGLPLGLVGDATYDNRILDLPPGATLALFTDGLMNAPIAGGGRFGLQGLVELAGVASQVADAAALGDCVAAVCGGVGAHIEDDALMLLCRRGAAVAPCASWPAPRLAEAPSGRRVLVVEDDEDMREIIVAYMATAGVTAAEAECGEDALALLEAASEPFDAVLLDKRMPGKDGLGMDGLAVLRRIKAMPRHQDTPVVMLTGATSPGDMAEGIAAGAFHYLTKPVHLATTVAVVKAAIFDFARFRSRRGDEGDGDVLALMDAGRLPFRTMDEARALSRLLSRLCPDPIRAAGGLAELLTNAVEHGNLGITYAEKSRFLMDGSFKREILRRQELPGMAARIATVSFRRRGADVVFRIRDQGEGFDWRPFLDFDPDRLTHPHGRGIAMARRLAFSEVRYIGRGNEVIARIGEAP